jgi:hypothetical protein
MAVLRIFDIKKDRIADGKSPSLRNLIEIAGDSLWQNCNMIVISVFRRLGTLFAVMQNKQVRRSFTEHQVRERLKSGDISVNKFYAF